MATQEITQEDVKHVATLCNLSLTESEIERLAIMFTSTLEYFKVFGELDTSSTPETHQVTGLTNVFQTASESSTTLSQEAALSSAPKVQNNLFATKAVFQQ